MTKSLTEKWKNGELPDGHYYVQYDKCSPFIKDAYGMIELKRCIDSEKIEVLAPVPSYDEYNKLRKLPLKCFQLEEDNSALMVINKDMCKEIKRLQKQLEIATKALKEINKNYRFTVAQDVVYKALKEMEGVK